MRNVAGDDEELYYFRSLVQCLREAQVVSANHTPGSRGDDPPVERLAAAIASLSAAIGSLDPPPAVMAAHRRLVNALREEARLLSGAPDRAGVSNADIETCLVAAGEALQDLGLTARARGVELAVDPAQRAFGWGRMPGS